jgi:hypothetical protein
MNLEKLYSKLTPEERFKLYLKAIARGDETEAERLMEMDPLEGLNLINGFMRFQVDFERTRLELLRQGKDLSAFLWGFSGFLMKEGMEPEEVLGYELSLQGSAETKEVQRWRKLWEEKWQRIFRRP